MSRIYEHYEKILRLRKGEELLFWILHKIMEIFFSRLMLIDQCRISFSAVHDTNLVRMMSIFFY